MLKSFVFTNCAVESRSNNLYFKRWFILCRLVMWQIKNAVTDVLALDIDSGFLCNGRPCTCPLNYRVPPQNWMSEWIQREGLKDYRKEFNIPGLGNKSVMITLPIAADPIRLLLWPEETLRIEPEPKVEGQERP